MIAGPGAFAVLSAIVFCLGVTGLLLRDDVAGTLVAAVLLTAAPVVALVGFAHIGQGSNVPATGDALAFLALAGLAAEVLLGAGLAMLLWRRSRAGGALDSDV